LEGVGSETHVHKIATYSTENRIQL
jgi:hypothetical protein